MSDREPEPRTVTTEDLDLAALLLAEGATLSSLAPGGTPGRHRFTLAGERVRLVAGSYVRGDALVSLDAFLTARRSLLDRLHRAERVR